MKKAIEKIDAIMNHICLLSKKYDVTISLDDTPHFINDELVEATGLYNASFSGGSFKWPILDLNKPDSFQKLNDALDKDFDRPCNKLFDVEACSILNQLKNAKENLLMGNIENGIITIIDAMRKLPDFKQSLKELDSRIKAGKGKNGKIKKTKYNSTPDKIRAYIKKELDDGKQYEKEIVKNAAQIFKVKASFIKKEYPKKSFKN